MADQKLTALTALASLSADDLFYVVDDPAGAATSHKLATSVLDARFATAAQGALAATALQPADIGVTVQGYDADLATIAGLAKTDGNFIVGDGAAWTVESGATALASIGGAPVGAKYIVQTPDGTLTNEQALSALATGLLKNTTTTGVLSIAAQGTDYYAPGGTDVAIADGGTGQSTAQAAIDVRANVAAATNEHVLTKDTATGNAIFKAAAGGSGSPGGADTQVQFNDGGAFGGDTALVWNKTTNLLTLAGTQKINVNSTTALFVEQDGVRNDTFIVDTTNGRVGIGIAPDAPLHINQEFSGAPFYSSIILTPPAGSASPDTAVGLESRRASTTQRWYFGTGSGGNPVTNWFRIVDLTVGNIDRFNITTTGAIGMGGNMNGALLDNSVLLVSTANKSIGINTAGVEPAGSKLYIRDEVVTTNTVQDTIIIDARNATMSQVGFGAGISILGQSTTTYAVGMGHLTWEWATPTHASRKARAKWTVFDTAEREGIRIEASGTAPMLGFLGAAAIARPTTYTLAATATRTMPTPEATFTGQDNAQGGSVYAKFADLATLQTRLDSVEGVLRQLIIDLASTSGYGLLVAS